MHILAAVLLVAASATGCDSLEADETMERAGAYEQANTGADKSRALTREPSVLPVPKYSVFASFRIETDVASFLEYSSGEVEIIATGSVAARALNVMKRVYDLSKLEMFEVLGGRRTDAPEALLLDHRVTHGDRPRTRRYPTLEAILADESKLVGDELYLGTDCNTDTCGSNGFILTGVLTTALETCAEEDAYSDWQNYLSSYLYYPWSSPNVSGPLDVLGTYGQFGEGEWSKEEDGVPWTVQIHLPPTKAGGVAFCSRDFEESGPKITVQEELFPGAWFNHWSEQWISSGYPQGIVFDGDLKRHSIRVVIKKAPEGGIDHDDGTVFWWGAGY